MMDSNEHVDSLRLIGGKLCLDFVNTIDGRAGDDPYEYLTDYDQIVAWGRRVEILSEGLAQRLIKRGHNNSLAADSAFDAILEFRETLFRLFLASLNNQPPLAQDIIRLNYAIENAASQYVVEPGDTGYQWRLPDRLDGLLWAVIWSAADLLTSDQLNSVKMCEADGCGWLFLDTSRNQSRRWCSMETCGNRAKAKRHYKKTRSKQT
jgi:predicted RNA-binding Zn ribbon-like protein